MVLYIKYREIYFKKQHGNRGARENMDFLFVQWPDFQGDISRWDVSNVKSMRNMFEHCAFNGDISRWDVSKVANMQAMFRSSAFNQDISRWQPFNVSYFNETFEESEYAHPLFVETPHPQQHDHSLDGMLYRSKALWTPQPLMGLTEHQYCHNRNLKSIQIYSA